MCAFVCVSTLSPSFGDDEWVDHRQTDVDSWSGCVCVRRGVLFQPDCGNFVLNLLMGIIPRGGLHNVTPYYFAARENAVEASSFSQLLARNFEV